MKIGYTLIFIIALSSLFAACSGRGDMIEYRDEHNIVINGDSIKGDKLFKKLYYEDSDLKKVEIYTQSSERKDSLGNPKRKMWGVEVYDIPEKEKKKVRAEYPKDGWSFSFAFGTWEEMGEYTFYRKEYERMPGYGKITEELYDKSELVIYETYTEIENHIAKNQKYLNTSTTQTVRN